VALNDADCRASVLCQTEQMCFANNGACTRKTTN
jgi:hypothetical protein